MPAPKAPADPFDARIVRKLADILNDTGLSEIEVEHGALKIRVARTLTAPTTVYAAAPQLAPAPAAAAPAPAAAAPAEPVRTVYLQPSPGAEPFAKVGDTVAEGQTLLLIEAMKTMNPIVAPRAGKIVEFIVGDTQPVEFGEPLVVIE
jgi:acetyl-CoA carboxylase biotin carboxyl carrier protein